MTGFILCGLFGTMIYYLKKVSDDITRIYDEFQMLNDYTNATSFGATPQKVLGTETVQ